MGLLSIEKRLIDEMMHLLGLNALGMYVNLAYLAYARYINLSIAFIINIFLLIEVFSTSDAGRTVASVFQYLNLAISVVVLGFWAIFEMPLEVKLAMTEFSSSSTSQSNQSFKKKKRS